jgi:hypothetical protein
VEGVLVVGGQVNPPPYAPTLLYPTSGQYVDLSGSVTFEWQYNPAQAGLTQTAYAFLLLTNSCTTAQYWNASTNAFQSTQVFNTSSNQYVTFPVGTFIDGYSYQWAVITEDANGTSPPSPYNVVNAQAAPMVRVTSPSGTIGTSTPVITWVTRFPTGASQLGYYVCVYTQAQVSAPGFTPGQPPYVYASGFVGGQSSQLALASQNVFLVQGTTYYFYVQVVETGYEPSAWAYAVGTVSYVAPNAPYTVIEQTTDPNTGYPVMALTITSQDNWLTAADSYPTSSGGYSWVATNGTLRVTTSGVLTITAS